jgi:O-acetyl-ADP-ribose deacetylase (regulator of RNase III)
MINYVQGDATQPIGDGPRFIIHCCNDIGAWGAGFVMAVSRRWPDPEEAYYALGGKCNGYSLGNVQMVEVDEDLWVVNMIGQSGVGRRGDATPPIRYKAIRLALQRVAEAAKSTDYRGLYKAVSIHAPRFGAGLAGGDWNIIEKLINEELIDEGIEVTVYDFAG